MSPTKLKYTISQSAHITNFFCSIFETLMIAMNNQNDICNFSRQRFTSSCKSIDLRKYSFRKLLLKLIGKKSQTPSSEDLLVAPPINSKLSEIESNFVESIFIEHIDRERWKMCKSSKEAKDPRWLDGTLNWIWARPVRLFCHRRAFFLLRSVASPYHSL